MKYLALLRGINVGGNNKVPMSHLRKCFERLGFKDVQTYINSGNVIFDTPIRNKKELVDLCENALQAEFNFAIPCCVISAQELQQALQHAPQWWGNSTDEKHNALFTIAPVTAKQVTQEMGEINSKYEKIATYEPVIFWTAGIATFSRTNYSKIVGSRLYKSITIRNANTTRKLHELCLSKTSN